MKPKHLYTPEPQKERQKEKEKRPRSSKLYILRTVKLLALFILVAVTAGFLQEYVLCHADHNRERLKGFYLEENNSLDVVFLGASEVYSDFSPGYAYDKHGVTSYLFSTQANSMLNYKAQLKNVLSRQNPDLIVIELNGALYDNDGETTKEANLRNYSDNVPMDLIKAEWIYENIGDDFLEYAFPILKYHNTWQDIPGNMLYQKTVAEDRLRGYSYLKGILNEAAVFKSTQRSMNDMLSKSAGSKRPLGALEEQSLRELLQFCRDENLTNVVFARFPHIVVRRTFNRFERSNTVADIVKEYGFDYLNFELNYEQTGLDENVDFYNLDHLNIYGQQKFTDYLMNYLKSNYTVNARQQSDRQKEIWSECSDYYKAYCRYSDELIKSGNGRELSEDSDLIEILKDYLPDKN